MQALDVSYILHATEDPKKVEAAVSKFLAIDGTPETDMLEGHFGNQIRRVRYHLTGDEAERSFRGLVAHLPRSFKDDLKRNLGASLDEHSALFLRLDKQKLVNGALEPGSGDSVRVKVKPRSFVVRGRAEEFYAETLFGGE